MKNVSISEILKTAASFKDVKERIAFLVRYDSLALRTILQGIFDPHIKYLLPEGRLEYNPSHVDEANLLYTESRKMYLFVEGGHPTLAQARREWLFIQMLENVAPDDAELLLLMKDKKSPHKEINRKVVTAAFPGLIQQPG